MVHWKALIKRFTARPQRGLRWEIIVSLGVLMLAAVTFMGATALKSAERAIILQKVEALTQVTKVLGSAVTRQWQAGGNVPERINTLFRDLGTSTAITEFAVVDGNGRMIAHSREEQIGRRVRDPSLFRAMETRRLVHPDELDPSPGKENWLDLLFTPAGSWTFAVPVIIDNKVMGAFSVQYPLEGVLLTLRVHRRIVFSMAVIDALVIIVFGIWLIGRTAISPILHISRGAQSLASGQYDTRVRVTGPREISILAESFNRMAERIQTAVNQQEEHSAALERVNRELKKAQKEIVRVEKMASVGQLAAGIAHEIGNPLAAVLGYAAILQKENNDPEAAQYLGHIVRETTRIQRIISGLLEFSRPREIQVQPLDIGSLIRETADLVTPQRIFRQVSVEMKLPEGSLVVSGDRHQLQQALVNLFLNAAQAMEGDGTLLIEAESRALKAGEGGIPRRRATDYQRRRATDPKNEDFDVVRSSFSGLPELRENDPVVALTITDSGPGIPQEILGRIFDPFFTTKATGEGTGLGLSITYGIVEAHGGALWAGNHERGGAQFTILLPEKKSGA